MKNTLQFKSVEFKSYKADSDNNLIISGYGAVFGNIDSYGEIIQKGAFAKTLVEREGRIAFCYQHDIWRPIGKIIEISEDDYGLKIEVMISASEMDIQTKIKEGILKEMSIGYRVIQASAGNVVDGQTTYLLTEVKLVEVSLVTVAANPLAVINNMKGEQAVDYIKNEFDRLIAIVRNDNIKFEIEKLKSLSLSALATQRSESQNEDEKIKLTKNEILKFLQNGR